MITESEALLKALEEKASELPGTKKEFLVSVGHYLWGHSYKWVKKDNAALAEMSRRLITIADTDEDEYETTRAKVILGALAVTSSQVMLVGSALWAECAFNQIVMGHKYAASLLATKVSSEILKDVIPPWRAFYITIPEGLLFVHNKDKEFPLLGVLVYQLETVEGDPRWCYLATTGTSMELWRHGYTTEMLTDKEPGPESGQSLWWCSQAMTSLDERTTFLLSRLIINTCLAMSNPDQVTPPREPKKKKGKHNKRGSNEPQVRTYQLGKTPVVTDCRAGILNFLRTGREGSELNVQVLVAGHWKSQPHGPRRSLRKVMRIEPYWRGPEDSPILVRPHVVGRA